MIEFSPHIAVDVQDREQAVALYTAVLGMEVVDADPEEAVLRCGDITFYVQEAATPQVYLDFATEDLETLVASLRDSGCELREIGGDDADTGYMVDDGNGLCFHLFEGPTER